jgi:3-dehydroquinate synthase
VQLHRGNLFLVGLPGAGKSTLGRMLARRLGLAFVDADAELERRLGVTIPMVFEIEGEAIFRDREEATLAELVTRTGVVLALADLNPQVRRELDEYGLAPTIGTDRIFATTADLVAAYRAAPEPSRPAAPPAA